MINIVNEAINKKLDSISFTTVITGIVESLEPLKIKLNDRITIGLDFIEPKSLGINDNSPNPALPFIIGDKINMIRYNNGQRFYVLGASMAPIEPEDPIYLNTNNSDSLSVNDSEEIIGTIKLHKVSKTGNYNDLKNLPSFSNYVTLNGAQTITAKKTFNTLPESSVAPLSDNQFTNKKYVDDNLLYYDVLETF